MNRKALYFTAALAVLSLCACGGDADGSDGEFYAVISSNPDNLDPQILTEAADLLMVPPKAIPFPMTGLPIHSSSEMDFSGLE